MALIPTQDNPPTAAFVETVDEITRIYKSLPPRPIIEEVEAARSVLITVDSEEQMKQDEISREEKPPGVPEALFSVLQQVKKKRVLLQSHEQRKEALYTVDLDKIFRAFDELIQRASELVSGNSQIKKEADVGIPVSKKAIDGVISDVSLIKKKKDDAVPDSDAPKGLVKISSTKAGLSLGKSSSTKAGLSLGEGDTEKLSLMKVAGLIEATAKTGAGALDLHGKLMDQIEWLPVSIGKLTDITELNISENRIMALPPTICSLKALIKLDIHSNQLINLPDSFCELVNLTDLDLHANRLSSLPASFGNLTNLMNLDLSSNQLTLLPETLGNLTCLKRLNLDTNELEELPYSIGSCSSLVELRLDFNKLKALPEAVGKLECLEVLTLYYNRVKGLPTTIGNLSKLKELDVSFNELESIPENLCFATSLVKLNVASNFADLTALPRSIGNLEMLEELNISNDQIRVLPDSIRYLSKLRVLHADETPLEVPPKEVTKLGAQAVVQYMADLVARKEGRSQPIEQKKGFWFWFCSLCKRSRRKQRNA